MPIAENIKHIYEPNPLACGQAVLAMLTGVCVQEIISEVGTSRETKLKDMFSCLERHGIKYSPQRVAVEDKNQLPEICILSLETPKCWHWSLYAREKFYDPEYGVLEDFPPSKRRYYFKIEV